MENFIWILISVIILYGISIVHVYKWFLTDRDITLLDIFAFLLISLIAPLMSFFILIDKIVIRKVK